MGGAGSPQKFARGVLCIGSAVVTTLKEKEREAIAVDFASQAQKYFETITSRNDHNK